MDKRKSILNVVVSIVFRFFMLVGSIIVRRFLIKYIGNEVNGLNSLFESLIGFLSVAELGVGSAITFCMYKPIVEQDENKVAALYQLFTKTYRIIGAIVLLAGSLLIPLMPYLAKDYLELDVNLGTTFFLMLLSVVISYVFSAKTSLINAYKNNYITTAISSTGMILQYVLQIIVVIFTNSFTGYLICRIVAMLFQWAVTEIYTYKQHVRILKHKREQIDLDTKQEIINKVKALFMHRIGGILVNSADSMIISAYIGVVVLGKYSNYSTIAVSMSSVIALFFSPLTSIIGHMFITEKDETERYYNKFYALNYILGVVFFLGYYAVIESLFAILFGENLELSNSVVLVIIMNYYVQFMRQSTLLFRDATGTFYNDRWKPLFEGILNVILSVIFVKLFGLSGGDELGVVGVIVATIITNLTICHIVEPLVLYKHAFKKPVKGHLITNYIYIFMFVIVLFLMDRCMITHDSEMIEMLLNGCISLMFSAGIAFVVIMTNKEIRKVIASKIKGR